MNRWLVWTALIALLLIGFLTALALRGGAPPLDRLGPAPDFNLTSQHGTPFSRADLAGKVWLADFMFTRCRGICPLLADRMRGFQERFAAEKGWMLVSFSVDPENDRPDTLAAYAAQKGADPARWVFLTGDKTAIFRMITDGFRLAVEENAGNSAEPTLHSPRIVLVDRAGEMRGFYDALDEDSMAKLAGDLRALLRARG